MTSWPWMKGVEVALADPCPPVCAEDDRPAVKDLIVEYRAKIDKITEAVGEHPLYHPNKHDDLWVLRFWMSHKISKAAIDAAKYTLDFRKEHGLDEKDIRETAPHTIEEGKVYEYLKCWKEDAMVSKLLPPSFGEGKELAKHDRTVVEVNVKHYDVFNGACKMPFNAGLLHYFFAAK